MRCQDCTNFFDIAQEKSRVSFEQKKKIVKETDSKLYVGCFTKRAAHVSFSRAL